MTNLIQGLGWGLNRYKTLVVGYGDTGSHVAKALKARNVDVTVFDQDETRRRKAVSDGFQSGESLASVVQDRKLIIGCTGKVPFQFKELLSISDGTVFVNASSKRRELNYQELDLLTDGAVARKVLSGVGHERQLINGRRLIVLADGYPVNFVGDSVPNQEIGFILALLIRAAVYLASESSSLMPGFLPVPNDLQAEIERLHEGFAGNV